MKKSTTVNNYHHGDLRNALIQIAAELVITHGVEGFSLREAARRIGVTPAACYRHFADKAALLKAIAIEGFTELAERMETEYLSDTSRAKSAIKQAKQRFYAVGIAYIKFAVENPAQFRVMFGPYGAGGSEPVRGVAKVSGKDSYEIFVDALNDLVISGAVNQDSREQAELPAWASIHGLAALLVDGLVRPESEQELIVITENVITHTLKSMSLSDN